MSVSKVPAVSPVPAENITALNVDIEQIKTNLDTDFDLIKQSKEWQTAKSKRDEAWTFKEASDKSGVSWIRVRGDLTGVPIDSVADLLDKNLESRQAEWHDLFMGGSVLAQLNEKDPHVELAYFRYKSPMMFVSPRETLYTKARRETRDEEGRLTSLLLSYRSVDENAELIAKDSKCERITLKSAHLIERTIVDNVESTVYWCIQWSNPGGMLSKFAGLSRDGQLNTMIQEIEGIRKACKNSTVTSSATPAAEVTADETKPETNVAAAAVATAVAALEEYAEKAEEPVVEEKVNEKAEEPIVVPAAAVVAQPEETFQVEEPVQAEEPVVVAAAIVAEPEAPFQAAEPEQTEQPAVEEPVKSEPVETEQPQQSEESTQAEEPAQPEATPESAPEPEITESEQETEVVEPVQEPEAEVTETQTEEAAVETTSETAAEPTTDALEQEPATDALE